MRMHKPLLILSLALVGLSPLLSACGPNGVIAISIDLAPVSVPAVPDDLATANLSALATASGHVAVDVIEDSATVTAAGLPDLPDGYRYVVELGYTHEPRGQLGEPTPTELWTFAPPADAGGEEGHDEEGGHDEGTLEVTNHRLRTHGDGDGDYEVEIGPDEIGDQNFAGVRSGIVRIVSTDGNTLLDVLKGAVEAEHAEAEAGGHAHGV